MTAKPEIVNPLDHEDWDTLVRSTAGHTIFHTSVWAKVLHESYGYTPFYFTVRENGHFSALLPVMEVNSFLTGMRGVSLPFSDFCEPIVSGNVSFNDIFYFLTGFGKERDWNYVELRGAHPFSESSIPAQFYILHTLDIAKNIAAIHSHFRSSTQRNIRKAEREGVRVTIHHTPEAAREFYSLHCLTRKHHGLPPQPYLFFQKVHEHIIAKKLGLIALASWNDRIIAGAVFFHYGKNAFLKYAASDRHFQHLRANNLIIWEALKYYAANGYASFGFGRTHPENRGLLQFKRSWGAKEEVIHYFKYDLINDCFLSNHSRGESSYPFFKMMPLPLLKLTGRLLYRHVG